MIFRGLYVYSTYFAVFSEAWRLISYLGIFLKPSLDRKKTIGESYFGFTFTWSFTNGSKEFKKTYDLRSRSERIFSKFFYLTFLLKFLTSGGYRLSPIIIILSHILVLLVVLTTIKTENKEKIHFVNEIFFNYYLIFKEQAF